MLCKMLEYFPINTTSEKISQIAVHEILTHRTVREKMGV